MVRETPNSFSVSTVVSPPRAKGATTPPVMSAATIVIAIRDLRLLIASPPVGCAGLAGREREALGGHRAGVIDGDAEDNAADGVDDVPSADGRGDQYSSRQEQIFRHGRVLRSDQCA